MMDPLVNAYQNEHRAPSKAELENCDRIARKAMVKNAVQMHVLCALGLVF